MTAVRQTWQVYLRNLRVLMRQPAFLLITLIQPVIWLLLFAALFKAVADIPGFHGTYLNFFTPGVVVMLALFSAGWSGMGFVEDIQSGVMGRQLASPVWRGALNAGAVAYSAFAVIIQALLIIALALILGADFKGGVIGVIVMILIGALLAAAVSSLSNAVGVLGRQRETVIGTVSFFQLPLTFLSTGMMQKSLLPHWIQEVAKFNPINWAVVGARAAAMQRTDWGVVGARVGLLVALVLVSAFLAQRAFARYQRSL
ncbi:MAG TPA: ABC transporter permease [Solirubrobacteraceae bacterium]|nr:ABC transporter permease [Solirubrobacteraceae bacterium]